MKVIESVIDDLPFLAVADKTGETKGLELLGYCGLLHTG
jgi:hypothetical protein